MSQLLMDHAAGLIPSGLTLHSFHNWFDMTNYDSVCRVDLTAWALRNKARMGVHIGTASRMVAMGVTVAKLAVGDLLQVHGDFASLERALTTLLRTVRA